MVLLLDEGGGVGGQAGGRLGGGVEMVCEPMAWLFLCHGLSLRIPYTAAPQA